MKDGDLVSCISYSFALSLFKTEPDPVFALLARRKVQIVNQGPEKRELATRTGLKIVRIKILILQMRLSEERQECSGRNHRSWLCKMQIRRSQKTHTCL